jgi:hypothetical protein
VTMTTHAPQTNRLARRCLCSAYKQRTHVASPSRSVNPIRRQQHTERRARRSRPTAMRLDPADIEQIARQVAELIAATQARPSGQFVDASELAQLLGVERDWVYSHANVLGAIRLGGPRGRLRFDLQRVQDTWPAPTTSVARRPTGRSRKKRATATRQGLIPYESERPGIMSSSSRERRA